jgi:hypothetical protein
MSITPSAGSGSLNISQTAVFQNELAATMTGSATKIGTLVASPRIVIFDNQGTASVAIGIGPAATTPTPTIATWRTFPAGEALVLDLSTNKAAAPNFLIGASGTFSISYLTATP